MANLRGTAARYPDDPGIRSLINRLTTESGEFRELWAEQDVEVEHSTHKRTHHPLVGWLDLDCETLHDPDRDQYTIFYTAQPGTPSHEALRLLKVVGTQEMAAWD